MILARVRVRLVEMFALLPVSKADSTPTAIDDKAANWLVEADDKKSGVTVTNVETGQYLSTDGQRATVSSQPYVWEIKAGTQELEYR